MIMVRSEILNKKTNIVSFWLNYVIERSNNRMETTELASTLSFAKLASEVLAFHKGSQVSSFATSLEKKQC